MLYNDRGICYERPEVVRLKAGVSLEMFEEGLLIRVIIWVYLNISQAFTAGMIDLTRLLHP